MEDKSKKAANVFLRQNKLKTVSADILKQIMEKQGYTVVEYNNGSNREEVDTLIREFGLSDYVQYSKGFTYADSNCRLVFLNEDLSENEKLIVLAHEEGHIFLEHFGETPIIGRDVMQEYEANEFAHYLLNPDPFMKIRRNKLKIILSAAVIALAVGICFAVKAYRTEQSYYGEFYVTATGHKYHEADCIYVKDKDSVRRLTKEEFENGDYEPCGMCLPNGTKLGDGL